MKTKILSGYALIFPLMLSAQLASIGDRSKMILEEGQQFEVPAGHELTILEIFLDAGKQRQPLNDPAEFCGKKEIIPYSERVLRINNMLITFEPQSSKDYEGERPGPLRTQLPLTLPAGTRICVPKKHPTSGVLILLERTSL